MIAASRTNNELPGKMVSHSSTGNYTYLLIPAERSPGTCKESLQRVLACRKYCNCNWNLLCFLFPSMNVREYIAFTLATGDGLWEVPFTPTWVSNLGLNVPPLITPCANRVVKPNGEFSASHRVNLKKSFRMIAVSCTFSSCQKFISFPQLGEWATYYSAWVSPLWGTREWDLRVCFWFTFIFHVKFYLTLFLMPAGNCSFPSFHTQCLPPFNDSSTKKKNVKRENLVDTFYTGNATQFPVVTSTYQFVTRLWVQTRPDKIIWCGAKLVNSKCVALQNDWKKHTLKKQLNFECLSLCHPPTKNIQHVVPVDWHNPANKLGWIKTLASSCR